MACNRQTGLIFVIFIHGHNFLQTFSPHKTDFATKQRNKYQVCQQGKRNFPEQIENFCIIFMRGEDNVKTTGCGERRTYSGQQPLFSKRREAALLKSTNTNTNT